MKETMKKVLDGWMGVYGVMSVIGDEGRHKTGLSRLTYNNHLVSFVLCFIQLPRKLVQSVI